MRSTITKGAVLRPFVLFALSCVAVAQTGTPDSPYIRKQSKASSSQEATLGWILPDGSVVASVKAEEIAFLSAGQAGKARFKKALRKEEIATLTRKFRYPCEPLEQPLFLYHAQSAMAESQQVIVLGNAAKIKYLGRKLDPKAKLSGQVLARLRVMKNEELLKEVWAADHQNAQYVVAGVYDRLTGQLVRQGLFLHDFPGTLLGGKIDQVSEETMCDGCGVPTKERGLDVVYDVRALFAIEGFDYPLLLVDTSTIEGEAISLITFSKAPKRESQYQELRFYEYRSCH
jgi:hypothetical protein